MKKTVAVLATIFLICFIFLSRGEAAETSQFRDWIVSLTADTSPPTASLLYVLEDPGGAKNNRKVTIANLFSLKIGTVTSGKVCLADGSGIIQCVTDPYQTVLTNPITGTGTQYYLPVWGASGVGALASLGSSGSLLKSAGAGANPAWTTETFAAPGAAYALLSSDGTNWVRLATSANITSFLGSADYSTARTNLGLAIGTNVQAYSAALLSLASLTETNGGIPYGTADNTYAWLAAGAANTVLMGNGAAAPSFSAFTLAAPGAANALLGSDGTNWTRVTSISLDDSAAQFYNTAAPTKLIRMDASGLTAGETAVIKPVGAYTLTYTLTGATGVTFPTTGTLASLAGTETLTNKTITAPLITNPEVDGSATANWTSVPANVKNTMVHNCGMGATASTITLPTAAVGYAFVATVCQPASATAWKFLATGSETIIVDEVKGKTYAQRTAPVMGDSLTCWTGKNSGDGMAVTVTLSQGSTTTAAAHTAVTFVIAGVGYAKAADAVGVALTAVTTAANDKYGAQALDIGADGTIHAISGTNIATGFTAAADARADVPAPTAGHVRMGYVTAKRANAAGFVWATDNLATTGEYTVAFTSSALLTAGYGWNCKSGKTAWTTD
jgi:hypothetical protein